MKYSTGCRSTIRRQLSIISGVKFNGSLQGESKLGFQIYRVDLSTGLHRQ